MDSLKEYDKELTAELNKREGDVHQQFPVIMRVKGLVSEYNALRGILESVTNELDKQNNADVDKHLPLVRRVRGLVQSYNYLQKQYLRKEL